MIKPYNDKTHARPKGFIEGNGGYMPHDTLVSPREGWHEIDPGFGISRKYEI
jgi:hypothetical protein